jgi:hypothetical protein
MKSPRAVLFDFGDILIKDVSFMRSRGNEAVFRTSCPTRSPSYLESQLAFGQTKRKHGDVTNRAFWRGLAQ